MADNKPSSKDLVVGFLLFSFTIAINVSGFLGFGRTAYRQYPAALAAVQALEFIVFLNVIKTLDAHSDLLRKYFTLINTVLLIVSFAFFLTAYRTHQPQVVFEVRGPPGCEGSVIAPLESCRQARVMQCSQSSGVAVNIAGHIGEYINVPVLMSRSLATVPAVSCEVQCAWYALNAPFPVSFFLVADPNVAALSVSLVTNLTARSLAWAEYARQLADSERAAENQQQQQQQEERKRPLVKATPRELTPPEKQEETEAVGARVAPVPALPAVGVYCEPVSVPAAAAAANTHS